MHLGLTTTLNAPTFRAGDVMEVSLSMTPGTASPRVNAYLVLRLPNGQLLSWTPRGFVAGIAPLAQNVMPVNFRGVIARLAISRYVHMVICRYRRGQRCARVRYCGAALHHQVGPIRIDDRGADESSAGNEIVEVRRLGAQCASIPSSR